MKIWFQNRRTKWKKQNNISNAEAAEHKNLERKEKEIEGEKISNCKKSKVQIRSTPTAYTKICQDEKNLKEKDLTMKESTLDCKKGLDEIPIKSNIKPSTESNFNLNLSEKEEDLSKSIKVTNSDSVDFKSENIEFSDENVSTNENERMTLSGVYLLNSELEKSELESQENLSDDRPRIPVSVPLVSLVSMMETEDNSNIVIKEEEVYQPGFYTEQKFDD